MNESMVKKAISIITVLICAYGIYIFRDLIGYLLVSVGLSFAGRPIVDLVAKIKIKGKQLPSSIGALVALACSIYPHCTNSGRYNRERSPIHR